MPGSNPTTQAAQSGQFFYLGPWAFDVTAALQIIEAAPRPAWPLGVAEWAKALGLTRIDNPDPHTIGLIGPDRETFDAAYAMTTDLSIPLVLAMLPDPVGGNHVPLLIDGTHRLYRAMREGVDELPVHVLTADETARVRVDRWYGQFGAFTTRAQ
ncbi:hypothetical protein [Catellatospora sp. NPDC049133]|uniref:hypothetical protein n=1 Tax=Catellatospora sp. NPDC049133 TaxID=3155499 RepID=UPI0033E524D6